MRILFLKGRSATKVSFNEEKQKLPRPSSKERQVVAFVVL